jgi:hypothetical protein
MGPESTKFLIYFGNEIYEDEFQANKEKLLTVYVSKLSQNSDLSDYTLQTRTRARKQNAIIDAQ